MPTLDLQHLQNIAIELMNKLNFDVHYTTIPKGMFVTDIVGNGQYNAATHEIQVLSTLTHEEQKTVIIHELVHSMQDVSKWNQFKPYIEREHEVEAYAVQFLYNLLYQISYLSSILRVIDKRKKIKPKKWIEHTKREMIRDATISSHEDMGSIMGGVFQMPWEKERKY